MSNLPTLQTGADRKAVCDAALTQQSDPDYLAAQEAARQSAYTTHFSHVITNWANESGNVVSQAAQGTLDLPINELVDGNVLGVWESDLLDAGYLVTRGNASFKIELPTL